MIWVEIVTIGGEILKARTEDTNFAFLARGLRSRGIPLRWHTTVADERESLTAAIEGAIARADVVIATGGLGNTPDDVTRKILATVLKRNLILREDLLETLAAKYRAMGRTPPVNLQAQALIPFGSDLIDNEVGMAPGLRLRSADGKMVYALPGVPFEMERMAERFVLPEVAKLAGNAQSMERVLRTAGVGETVLADLLSREIPPEVQVAYLPHVGTVELRFGMEGDPRDVAPFLDRVVAVAKARLGPCVYAEGERTLEEIAGAALLSRGWKLGIAESLSGGGIGARVVSVPGSSRYFLGDIVAYANDVKIGLLSVPEGWIRDHGAVSAPVAEAMASGVRDRLGADVGIATTGIAGPDGGTTEKPVGLAYVGMVWPGGMVTVRRQFPGGRAQVIERTANLALDLVRRAALGLPVEQG